MMSKAVYGCRFRIKCDHLTVVVLVVVYMDKSLRYQSLDCIELNPLTTNLDKTILSTEEVDKISDDCAYIPSLEPIACMAI